MKIDKTHIRNAFGFINLSIDRFYLSILKLEEKRNDRFYKLKIINNMSDHELKCFQSIYNQVSIKNVADIHDYYQLTYLAPSIKNRLVSKLGGSKTVACFMVREGRLTFDLLKSVIED